MRSLADGIRAHQRRYLRVLMRRYPRPVDAARIADVHRQDLYAIGKRVGVPIRSRAAATASPKRMKTLRASVRAYERRYLTRLLKLHPEVTRAAKVAGVHRATLYEIAQRVGLRICSKYRSAHRGNAAWRALA